jgi:hypothetical protein
MKAPVLVIPGICSRLAPRTTVCAVPPRGFAASTFAMTATSLGIPNASVFSNLDLFRFEGLSGFDPLASVFIRGQKF